MNKVVIATFEVPGFHCWPDAPSEVSYLAGLHRHVFTFRAEVSVSDSDREVEFHLLQRDMHRVLVQRWPVHSMALVGHDFGSSSCEHLAEWLANELERYSYAVRAVEVWEDEENGARVEV